MTKQEYADYQSNVAAFFEREGLNCLTTSLDNCPDCDVEFDGGTCPECGEDAGHFPLEPHFSWSPCDCCGTHLGGNRMDASGYNPTTKEVQKGYSICTDCEYYNEYGQLDDMTMMEIETSPE